MKLISKKPVVFLYTKNKSSNKEIKKSIPFKIASVRVKHLGINLTKEVKDLCSESHNTDGKKLR